MHGLPWPSLFVQLNVSKGMAGVPHSSFLALSATAATLGLFPVAGVALLLCADRLMDSMRVVVHLLDNCVAPFVVARWEGQLDHARCAQSSPAKRNSNPRPQSRLWSRLSPRRSHRTRQPTPSPDHGLQKVSVVGASLRVDLEA